MSRGKTSSSLFWLSYGGWCGLVQPRPTCDCRYRRDSLAHFLLYWLRFALVAWLEVRSAAACVVISGCVVAACCVYCSCGGCYLCCCAD